MATSYTYSPTFSDILTETMDILKVNQDGQTLQGEDVNRCLRAYNMMVTSWQTKGMLMWTYTDGVLFLQKGQREYDLSQAVTAATGARLTNNIIFDALSVAAVATDTTITVDDGTKFSASDNIGVVMDSGTIHWTTVNGAPVGNVVTLTDAMPAAAAIDSVVYAYNDTYIPISRLIEDTGRYVDYSTSNQQEVIATQIDRIEYMNYPDKSTQGSPVNFYFQRATTVEQGNAHKFFIWSNPESGDMALNFSYERNVKIIGVKTDKIDFPQYWVEAICWNLAKRVMTKFGASAALVQEIKEGAHTTLVEALNYETPVTDVEIVIDGY